MLGASIHIAFDIEIHGNMKEFLLGGIDSYSL